MTENTVLTMKPAGERFLSLDFFRGVIMIILLLGETGFFDKLDFAADNSFTHFLQIQFVHSEWRGLHFWDILLPAFMLIAGTSMAFSHHKQQQISFPRKKYFLKILKRSFWLLFWGVLIYSVRKNHINFELSNVLVQLSVATLVASFVIRSPAWLQLTVSLLCLLIPELLFRFSKVPGFDQPFSNQHNFGNYVDLILINRVNSPDTSTSMNAISGIAHVIWGVMAGQLLLSAKSNSLKFIYLTGAGVLAVIIG